MAPILSFGSCSLLCALVSLSLAAPFANTTEKADYVLIGAGPSGLVLSEYLTRDPNVKVVLLEAGNNADDSPDVQVPGNSLDILANAELYYSQPDPNLNGYAPDLGQGRVVGGGTAINQMLYCRGAASVFDEWAQISGNEGLKWDSILDDFRAVSHLANQTGLNYPEVVNTSAFGNGPLEVAKYRALLDLDEPFITEIQSRYDLPEIDFVSGGGIGVTPGLASIRDTGKNRTRSYAYDTFGYLASARSNFILRPNVMATKIGFNGTTAHSVTYNDTTSGQVSIIQAKEVIVTAGAIDTPHLLMISGVGPSATLQQFGIPLVLDSPEVGQKLMDHHYALVEYEAAPAQGTSWKLEYNATWSAEQETLYYSNGSGFLGDNYGESFGAIRLPDSVFNGTGNFFPDLPADRPHVALVYTSVATLTEPAVNVSVVSAWAGLVQPESHGNVTLGSASITDAPLIFSNYYGAASEKAAIVYGYKQLRAVLSSDRIMPQHLVRELYPGANVTSDADIWTAIQNASRSWHHPVGTTALGTVLGADWRIKGTQGLRVVGASAIPYPPTCPIQASVYALAHRAAVDIAKADGLNVSY